MSGITEVGKAVFILRFGAAGITLQGDDGSHNGSVISTEKRNVVNDAVSTNGLEGTWSLDSDVRIPSSSVFWKSESPSVERLMKDDSSHQSSGVHQANANSVAVSSEYQIPEKEIELVMSQANCSRFSAMHALQKNGNDIVEAIMFVTGEQTEPKANTFSFPHFRSSATVCPSDLASEDNNKAEILVTKSVSASFPASRLPLKKTKKKSKGLIENMRDPNAQFDGNIMERSVNNHLPKISEGEHACKVLTDDDNRNEKQSVHNVGGDSSVVTGSSASSGMPGKCVFPDWDSAESQSGNDFTESSGTVASENMSICASEVSSGFTASTDRQMLKMFELEPAWEPPFPYRIGTRIGKNNRLSLLVAAEINDTRAVLDLLSLSGTDVNQTYPDGKTALYIACEHGHDGIVRRLLDHPGINIAKYAKSKQLRFRRNGGFNESGMLETETYFQTALECSCQQDHPKVVKAFLDCTKINLTETQLSRPLSVACQFGSLSNVREIIEKSLVDVNLTVGGVTPLMVACYHGHSSVVNYLLHLPQIEVNKQQASTGATALYLASQQGFHQIVRQLIDRQDVDVNRPTIRGKTPLCAACQDGHLLAVKMLLEHSEIEINRADTNGDTPLRVACQRGDHSMVQLLLEHPKIDQHKVCVCCISPLLVASFCGYSEIVQQFNAPKGVNRNCFCYWCCAPLRAYWRMEGNPSDDIQHLLEDQQSDVNSRTIRCCMTPLGFFSLRNDLFIQRQDEQIIRSLVEHPKIDPNKTSFYCITPLCTANDPEPFLEHPKIDPNKPSWCCITPLCLATDRLGLFLDHPKIDPNKVSCCCITPLCMADDPEPFLEHPKIDPNKVSCCCITPLFKAHDPKPFLEHPKIDPNKVSCCCITPLCCSVADQHRILLEHPKIDPNKRACCCITPLMTARCSPFLKAPERLKMQRDLKAAGGRYIPGFQQAERKPKPVWQKGDRVEFYHHGEKRFFAGTIYQGRPYLDKLYLRDENGKLRDKNGKCVKCDHQWADEDEVVHVCGAFDPPARSIFIRRDDSETFIWPEVDVYLLKKSPAGSAMQR